MLWISCQHKYRVYLEAFGSGHKTMLRGNSFTVLHLQFLKETARHAKQQLNNVKGLGLRLDVDKTYGSKMSNGDQNTR